MLLFRSCPPGSFVKICFSAPFYPISASCRPLHIPLFFHVHFVPLCISPSDVPTFFQFEPFLRNRLGNRLFPRASTVGRFVWLPGVAGRKFVAPFWPPPPPKFLGVWAFLCVMLFPCPNFFFSPPLFLFHPPIVSNFPTW